MVPGNPIMVGKLTVERGPRRGQVFYVKQGETFTVGRDRKSSLFIPSTEVTRVHCRVQGKRGVFTIRDMSSKNGTKVNDKLISARPLREGDMIEVSRCLMRFSLEEEVPEEGPAGSRPVFSETKPKPKPKSIVMPAVAPAPPPPAPEFTEEEEALIGQTFRDVKIIAGIARGRRTIIYKGAQASRNRLVAVKALPPSLGKNPDLTRWFVEGARTAGELSHEDIVDVLGGGKQQGIYYCVCEFMEGGDAMERFRNAPQEGAALVKKALESVVRLTRGLEYGCSKKVLHKGMRPSKVLFDEKGRANLCGLGFDNGPCASPGLKPPTAGEFFAPEQRRANTEPTIQSDLYGLGATFYYMLTGRPPVRGLKQSVDSPKHYNSTVPDSLCRIAEKLVEISPDNRYESYGQLLHDLRWALRGEAWPRE